MSLHAVMRVESASQKFGTSPPGERPWRAPFCKWLRRCLAAFLIFCFLLSALYFFRAPLLRGAAKAWIVDDKLERADAIVLLGGGLETRPFAAARLYREGYAKQILVARPKPTTADELGLTVRHEIVARLILLKEGVPESAITEIGRDVQNTRDESLAVREWVQANPAKALIIPTDVFHTRRVGWLFRKQLRDAGVHVMVQAVPVREYTVSAWWQRELGLVAFQNEVLKLAYYRLKY